MAISHIEINQKNIVNNMMTKIKEYLNKVLFKIGTFVFTLGKVLLIVLSFLLLILLWSWWKKRK